MRGLWMFMMLLGCRLSDAAWSLSTCPCKVPLETICVTGQEKVYVPCPKVTADELTFNLFRDQEMVSNVTCSHENNATKCAQWHTRPGLEVLDNKRESVNFVLTGVTERSQGTYHCEGMVTFPPPVRKVPGDQRIQVLLEGHICKCSTDQGNHGDQPSCRLHWIWVVVVVLLTLYSVTVTVIAVVYWVKLRDTDSNSDYMNAKPSAPNNRRKKRTIQKPIPRHF